MFSILDKVQGKLPQMLQQVKYPYGRKPLKGLSTKGSLQYNISTFELLIT
ncbi:MAG: hypothetical protein AB7V56_01480 [Candidatus Nitrosocosmicus sp.]